MCTFFVLMNSAAKIRFVLGAADAPLPKEAWPVQHRGLPHSSVYLGFLLVNYDSLRNI